MITGNKEFPLGRESPEPSYEVIILSTLQVILYGISGTDDNIRILRHLQAAMVPWVSENAMMTLSLRDITRLVPYKVFYPRLSHGPSYLIDMLFYPAAASYRSNLLHYIADSQKKRLLNMRIKSF